MIILTILMITIFIKHFIELIAKASNPMERHQILSGLIWSGLAATCLGSVTFLSFQSNKTLTYRS